VSEAIDILADGFRRAYADGDRELLSSLLDPDATWGVGEGDRTCHNRAEVLAWFDGLWRHGVRGTVSGVEKEPDGFVLLVDVQSPQGPFRVRQRMTVVGDRVATIMPDERLPE